MDFPAYGRSATCDDVRNDLNSKYCQHRKVFFRKSLNAGREQEQSNREACNANLENAKADFVLAKIKNLIDANEARMEQHKMTDRYRSFSELAENQRLGEDYAIRIEDRGAPAVILAPHGGWIEPGTSQIAEAIASTDMSFYAFEALKNGAHGDFHITSHCFDEPEAIELVGKSQCAIAIHGRKNGKNEAIWIGGRAIALGDIISNHLSDAGFAAERNEKLPGLNPMNICNRTLLGRGVQLELPLSLRRNLVGNAALLSIFSETVRNAILNVKPNGC